MYRRKGEDEPPAIGPQLSRAPTITDYTQNDGEQICMTLALANTMIHNIYKLNLSPSDIANYTKSNCNEYLSYLNFFRIKDLTKEQCSENGYYKILLFAYIYCSTRLEYNRIMKSTESIVDHRISFIKMYANLDNYRRIIPNIKLKSTQLFTPEQFDEIEQLHRTKFRDSNNKPPALLVQFGISGLVSRHPSLIKLKKLIIHSLFNNNYVCGDVDWRRGGSHEMVFTRYDYSTRNLYGKDGYRIVNYLPPKPGDSTQYRTEYLERIDATCTPFENYRINLEQLGYENEPHINDVAIQVHSTSRQFIPGYISWRWIEFYFCIPINITNPNGLNNTFRIIDSNPKYENYIDYIAFLISNPTTPFIEFSAWEKNPTYTVLPDYNGYSTPAPEPFVPVSRPTPLHVPSPKLPPGPVIAPAPQPWQVPREPIPRTPHFTFLRPDKSTFRPSILSIEPKKFRFQQDKNIYSFPPRELDYENPLTPNIKEDLPEMGIEEYAIIQRIMDLNKLYFKGDVLNPPVVKEQPWDFSIDPTEQPAAMTKERAALVRAQQQRAEEGAKEYAKYNKSLKSTAFSLTDRPPVGQARLRQNEPLNISKIEEDISQRQAKLLADKAERERLEEIESYRQSLIEAGKAREAEAASRLKEQIKKKADNESYLQQEEKKALVGYEEEQKQIEAEINSRVARQTAKDGKGVLSYFGFGGKRKTRRKKYLKRKSRKFKKLSKSMSNM